MFDFEALSQAIPNQTVLCVGDLMLDEFVYGEVSRISPEAPAPVIAVQRSETNVGGAGNVARNIASLGARCIFAGLVGEDEAGAQAESRSGAGEADRGRAGLAIPPARRRARCASSPSIFPPTCCARIGSMAVPASADVEQRLIDAILPLARRAPISCCCPTMPRAC